MIFSYRIAALGFCISSLAFASLGCGDDNSASSPVSPSAVPQLADTSSAPGLFQTATANLASLGTETVTLKASAPIPTSPANGATDIPCTTTQCATDRALNNEAAAVAPTLTVTNATASYATHSFSYAFALYKGSTLVETTRQDEGASGTTSYPVTELLDAATTYSWKARAVLNDGTTDAYGPWSTTFTFTTDAAPAPPVPDVIIGTPTPTWPIDGLTITDFTPHFVVTNGTNTGTTADIGTVYYEIQVATSRTPLVVFVTASTQARDGNTRIALRPSGSAWETELTASTIYYWRARGRNFGAKTHFVPGSTVIEVDASPWSEWHLFKTADASATGANAPYNCCPPANRLTVVQQVAAEIGYPGSGVDVRTLTQKVAEKLYAEDNRWGRRINDTGPLGKDTVAYKADDGRPYSIDIVSGAESSNPTVHWDPHGFVGGTWAAP